jgi:hypothetical protein
MSCLGTREQAEKGLQVEADRLHTDLYKLNVSALLNSCLEQRKAVDVSVFFPFHIISLAPLSILLALSFVCLSFSPTPCHVLLTKTLIHTRHTHTHTHTHTLHSLSLFLCLLSDGDIEPLGEERASLTPCQCGRGQQHFWLS